MVTLTEKIRDAIVAELHPDLSREKGVLASGQNVIDGQVVKDNGSGKLVAAVAGDTTVEGLIVGNWNVSADTPVPYVARLAAAKAARVTISGGALATTSAPVVTALNARNIFLR